MESYGGVWGSALSTCTEKAARTAEQHAYARGRRWRWPLECRNLTTVGAAWQPTLDKHDSVNYVPIDARLIKLAEWKPQRVVNRARRWRAVGREHLWCAEQPFQSRPSRWQRCHTIVVVLGITGIPPSFAGEELDCAEGAVG